jgi:hypothetical protein
VTKLDAFRFEIPIPFWAVIKPSTLRNVSVPTLWIFGWSMLITEKAVPTVDTLEPLIFANPEAFEPMSSP